MEEYRRWEMAKGGISDYTEWFSDILKGKALNQLLDEYRQTHPGKPVLAADMAGYGFVFDGLNIDNGLAVALGKHPGKPDQESIVGDMFSQNTWDQVKLWLNGNSFALGLCRPLAPFGYRHFISPEKFDFLVSHMAETLDEGGIFLVQTPLYLIPLSQFLAPQFRSKYNLSVITSTNLIGASMEFIK